jgi:hypothetical protein
MQFLHHCWLYRAVSDTGTELYYRIIEIFLE